MGVYGKSFSYNGHTSTEMGVIMVSFGSETSDFSNLGYNISKSSLNSHRSKVQSHSKSYSDVLTFTISLVKSNYQKFTTEEKRNVISWLTSPKTYRELEIVDEGNDNYHENITYYSICTGWQDMRPSPRMHYGLTFTFECNSPYGYGDLKTQSFISTSSTTLSVVVENDNLEDVIYPSFEILPRATAQIKIKNNTVAGSENFTVQANNNDRLYIDMERGIITDYAETFHYSNGSNLLWTTLVNGRNNIVITGNCTGTMTWREPRKVGI